VNTDNEVLESQKAALARDFIRSESGSADPRKRMLFLLDLNMPIMDGWEFVDQFNLFSESIRDRYEIYIVSSSVGPADISKAVSTPGIKGYHEKPVAGEFLDKIQTEYRATRAS
jgi:CheY-like chemotaxis protein